MMHISLKPATQNTAGIMSAQDKTSLDNFASNLVVMTQLNDTNIVLNSIGGKTKDSEMRKIVDNIGSVSMYMPGIITLSNKRGKLWCSCYIDKSIVEVSGTMKDMFISISIDKTMLFSDIDNIVYQLCNTQVVDVDPCILRTTSGMQTKKIAFTSSSSS